ncbi:MAG TPA: PepSY-like domain-containing protein [Chitinophagaceae bacterium]|nr:PepSY-like domain-containing protein [Chitinophagaceae bacterium]
MKKIFILFVVTALVFIQAYGQRLKESQVPAATKTAFQKQYPGNKVSWDKEGPGYEANFKQNGKTMSAVLDNNGTIIEIETDISINELPKSVNSYIAKKYPGSKTKEAAKVVKANGEINYEAEVNNKDVIFDEHGKFIKETKD